MSCRINNEVANGLAPRDRNIAMVFQSYALYPHLTVADNIAFGLKVRRVEKDAIAKKVREVAELLELTDFLNRKPAKLSGGQRQRVAMGRALVRSPNAFLMDEPLSNLDARLRGQMRAEIAKLQKMSAITTVYVTHDQVEAMTMGDRVAVMNKGTLQQLDTPRVLYDKPVNLFVASFIGSPPINFLEATIAAVDGAPGSHCGQLYPAAGRHRRPRAWPYRPQGHPRHPPRSAASSPADHRAGYPHRNEPLSSRISAPPCWCISMWRGLRCSTAASSRTKRT